MATIAGQVHGAGLPLGSIDLSGWSITGPLAASSGRLGASSQLVGLLDPELLHAPAGAPFAYPVFTPHPEDEALLAAWTRRRSDALRRRFGDGGGNDRTLDDLDASLVRGDAFRSLADPILSALSVGRVSSLAEQADIAVQMLATGVCHAVTLDTRERWDTHDVNSAQHGMFQRTFSALDHLMAALRDAGLLDRTVVAVVSEMTRTPLRNASTGKDHWGHGSALLLGAVRGGTVSGSTDHQVESLPMDLATGVPDPEGELCRYDSFCAGLLELVDVDPGDWLPGVVPFRGARPT